jgi:S-adenosylmethionine:tRNA ribosyltransferase-isomerase
MDVTAALSAFEYALPPALIAQRPLPDRSAARLLVWAANGGLRDAAVADLPRLLQPADLLVVNDTRVFPARLLGRAQPSGASAEVLLVAPHDAAGPLAWSALVRPGRRMRAGARARLEGDVEIEVAAVLRDGHRVVRFPAGVDPLEHARRHGHVPLPPYICRADDAQDRSRYQTVYAREDGSIAAPTAGLHLDGALLQRIESTGAAVAKVTLHVGPGTFRPVEEEQLTKGVLHPERYAVAALVLRAIRERRARGGRVVAIGTTTCRALESVDLNADSEQSGETALFIRPGYRFRAVDVLVSNFHLPRSSLLMLVAAFAGERWRAAYAHAVAGAYRFYSYGDASWIEPAVEA